MTTVVRLIQETRTTVVRLIQETRTIAVSLSQTPCTIAVTLKPASGMADLSALVARIEDLEANQLPAGNEGDILIYQGGAWGATDTLPTS